MEGSRKYITLTLPKTIDSFYMPANRSGENCVQHNTGETGLAKPTSSFDQVIIRYKGQRCH